MGQGDRSRGVDVRIDVGPIECHLLKNTPLLSVQVLWTGEHTQNRSLQETSECENVQRLEKLSLGANDVAIYWKFHLSRGKYEAQI